MRIEILELFHLKLFRKYINHKVKNSGIPIKNFLWGMEVIIIEIAKRIAVKPQLLLQGQLIEV